MAWLETLKKARPETASSTRDKVENRKETKEEAKAFPAASSSLSEPKDEEKPLRSPENVVPRLRLP